MPGRKAVPAVTIDNAKHKKNPEEIEKRIEVEELIAPKIRVRKPKGLSKIASRKFNELRRAYDSADLVLFTALDTTSLMIYCEAYAAYHVSQRVWAEFANNPEITVKDIVEIRPVLAEMNKQSDIMVKLSDSLLLTPSGRARIGSLSVSKKTKANPIHELAGFDK